MMHRSHVRSTVRAPRLTSSRARRLALGVAAAALLLPPASEAAAQELRYSLTPVGQRVQWDDDLGLENTWLYGGRAGFLFGEWVELQGFYLRSGGKVDTRFTETGLPAPGGGTLTEGEVDVDNYGADVIVNLGSWRLRPFLKAGGSVLRFDPEGGERTSQIALRAGGGVRFGDPGQLRVQLFVEDLAFRLNRYRLTAGEDLLPADPEGDDVRHNLVYGAGLSIPLGGAAGMDDTPQFGVGGLSLPLELFAGVLNFDDDDDLDGQNLVGLRTGLDFGRFVGLRGYYWRGVNDDFDGTQPLQSWGGEAQFNLNAGPGFAPFVVAGVGQLDFRDSFENDAGIELDDRTVLILGGGVSLRLSDRFRLNAAARSYLSGPNENLDDVERTDDLRGNWLFSAGLGFNIGGATSGPPRPPAPVVMREADTTGVSDTVFVDARTGERVRAPGRTRRARGDTAQMMRDSAEMRAMREMRELRDSLDREMRDSLDVMDTVFVDRLTGERVRRAELDRAARVQPPREGYVSERTTTINVPTEGEIYIRYGPERDAGTPVPMRRMEPGMPGGRMGPGMMPGQQPGMMPGQQQQQQPGMMPGQPGMMPGQPGMMPAQPGMMPGQPGMMPGQPYIQTPLSQAEMREAVREVIRDELERQRMGQVMEQQLAPEAGVRVAPGRVPSQRLTPPAGATPPAQQRRVPTVKEPLDTAALEARVMARVDQLVALQVQAYRDSVRAATPAAAADPALTRQLEERERERERRMLQEIERIVGEQVRREVERLPAAQVAPVTPTPTPTPAAEQQQPASQLFRPRAWATYAGATVSEDAQFVLGGRMNLGPFWSGLPSLALIPEVAFGFGGGATTTLIAANAEYAFGRLGMGNAGGFRPYVGVGVGAMNFSDELAGNDDGLEFVVNPALGALWEPRSGRTIAGANLFVEYQGVDFFDISRLNAGLRWDRMR